MSRRWSSTGILFLQTRVGKNMKKEPFKDLLKDRLMTFKGPFKGPLKDL